MFYVAYGSNLNVEQMRYRCPDAKIVGTAVIPNYRLMFKGSKTGAYCTIEPEQGASVPVGVWRVTGRDIEALDYYEGYPTFYYKKSLILPCSDGKRHKCFVYIMHEDRALGMPYPFYVNTCLQGYLDFGFDRKVFTEALDYTKARCKYGYSY